MSMYYQLSILPIPYTFSSSYIPQNSPSKPQSHGHVPEMDNKTLVTTTVFTSGRNTLSVFSYSRSSVQNV